MHFTLEQDAIGEALRVITRLAPPVSGNITISSDGKKLFISSNSETSRCSVNIPADVSGKAGLFALALTTFKDATKGRKTVAIDYTKTLCNISSGNYKCSLPTIDAIELDHDKEEKIGKPIKLTVEQAAWLKSAVSTVALKPTILLSTYMPLSVKLTDKGAFVACYDKNHMAFINSKEITGDMQVKLPIDIMGAVLDAFSNAPFRLELSTSSLYVTNVLVKVVLSLPQVEENEYTLEEVLEAASVSKTAKGSDIEVSKSELIALLDNARAVATKERSEVKVTMAEGKMRLEVVTANGSSKGVVKSSGSGKATFKVDFEYLDEAVRKSSDSVVMKLVKDEFIAFKLKEGTVVTSLNSED